MHWGGANAPPPKKKSEVQKGKRGNKREKRRKKKEKRRKKEEKREKRRKIEEKIVKNLPFIYFSEPFLFLLCENYVGIVKFSAKTQNYKEISLFNEKAIF